MLVGVGLGPGDPELLTLAAIKALKDSKKVFVPGKLAAELVSPYAEPEMLHFPMTEDKSELCESWEKNADIVAKEAKEHLVSFGSLGDPCFFSTFSYLRDVLGKKYPEIEVRTTPGVSAITAFASRAGISVNGSFEVSDGSPLGAKIVLKAKTPRAIARSQEAGGFHDFILVEHAFMEGERILKELPAKSDYFSILFARR